MSKYIDYMGGPIQEDKNDEAEIKRLHQGIENLLVILTNSKPHKMMHDLEQEINTLKHEKTTLLKHIELLESHDEN